MCIVNFIMHTGTPLMAGEKVLANKKTILSGETTLFLR